MENTAQPGNYAFAFHEAIVSYFKEVAPELPELLFEEFVDVVKFVVAGNLPRALVTLRNAIRSKHPMYVQDPWVEEDEEHNLFYGWLSNNDLKHKLTTYGSPPSYQKASDIVTLIKVNIRPIREAIREINTQPDVVSSTLDDGQSQFNTIPQTLGDLLSTHNGRTRKRSSAVPDPLEEE